MSAAKTLHFSRTLYAGTALDAAMQRLAGFARFERAEVPEHWAVTVHVRGSERRLRQVCGELCNQALGLTVRSGGPDEASP